MKIWYSLYNLNIKDPLNRQSQKSSQGFLIKLQTADFAEGFADCHPWALFGDLDVQGQLALLRQKKLSSLLKRSLFFAHIDGVAREERKSLFLKNIRIKSHYTCVNRELLTVEHLQTLRIAGYTTIKLKAGLQIDKEVRILSSLPPEIFSQFRWRLDFNGKNGHHFLNAINPFLRSQIECVEDPEAYHIERWQKLENKFSIPVAYDQPGRLKLDGRYPGIQVIKPARQNLFARGQDIVTNSMDHPVGQSFAFLQAQKSVERLKKQNTDYGLNTGHLFHADSWFREIQSDDCFFKPSLGYGIGFDHLWKELSWTRL